jgi:hypothetical protein
VDNFGVTHNPRIKEGKGEKLIPFKLFQYQKDFLKRLQWCYENDENMLVDKSRDMGATWCVLYFIFWRWLFEKNSTFLIGSQKGDDVDKFGNPNCLFGKYDIMLDWLEAKYSFLLPRGFNRNKHRNTMSIKNPQNQSYILGDSNTGDFSRSGRCNMIFMDEFASWENQEAVWSAVADTSPCNVMVSTPKGMSNTFAQLRFGGHIEHFEMHWRLHPGKAKDAKQDPITKNWTSPWYEREVYKRSTEDGQLLQTIKQELDINYIQTGDPVFPDEFLYLDIKKGVHPDPNENYAIGADVSGGLEGSDFQSFDIIAKSTGQQVYSWEGKLDPELFAYKLIAFGKLFNNALLGVEVNYSDLVMSIVKKNYTNLYHQKITSKATDEITTRVGWNTGWTNKEGMIGRLQSAIVNGNLKITHKRTLDELRIYKITEGSVVNKYSAPKGKHDDKVMSLGITWEVLQDVPMPLTEVQKQVMQERKKTSKRLVFSPTTGY